MKSRIGLILFLLVFSLAPAASACMNDGDTHRYEAYMRSDVYATPTVVNQSQWEQWQERGILWQMLGSATLGVASLIGACILAARKRKAATLAGEQKVPVAPLA